MSEGRLTRDDLNPNVLESLRGPQGEPGQQGPPGEPGPAGSDATVTSAAIENALGYTPANSSEVTSVEQQLYEVDTRLNTQLAHFAQLEFRESLAKTIKPIFDGFIPAQQENRWFQSICYIENENAILVGYNHPGVNVLSDIIKFSLEDYSVVSNKLNLELYHINDLTYNPITNEVIVATIAPENLSRQIGIVDYSTMTVKGYKNLELASNVAGIAYDKDINKYIAYTNKGLFILDGNFQYESTISYTGRKPNMVFQSIEVCNGYVFIYYNYFIHVVSYSGELIREWYFPVNNEAEGIAYIGNGDFLVGQISNFNYRNNPRLFKFNIHENYSNGCVLEITSFNDLGIVEGSETIQGIAVSLSNNSTLKYLKLPTNTSNIYPENQGTLEVEKYNIQNINFKFIGVSGDEYAGKYTHASSAWTGWNKILKESDTDNFVRAIQTSAQSIPNETTTNLIFDSLSLEVKNTYAKLVDGRISLAKGIYMVSSIVIFSPNATGTRTFRLNTKQGRQAALDTGTTPISLSDIIRVTSDNTLLNVAVNQTTGNNLNTLSGGYSFVEITKIGNI